MGDVGREIRRHRERLGLTQSELAARLATVSGNPAITRQDISRHEQGARTPRYWLPHYAQVFGIDVGVLRHSNAPDRTPDREPGRTPVDDEDDALELAQRASASDVGRETVAMLETVVDELAMAYPNTRPAELLTRTRRHLAYVHRLLDAKMTLAEHHRLLVVGGWLSLLAATSAIDLNAWPAARARLRTAATLAEQTEQRDLAAWCLETRAWRAVTVADWHRAVELSQQAQQAAPVGSSVLIQATAQEGRAWSRLRAGSETRTAINRVEAMVSPLPVPERPEHHYVYDPTKAHTYVATTLSWLGDIGAEPYARQVLDHLHTENGATRPRRVALAKLDLALALSSTGKPDEAAQHALDAITSGWVVPSNYWRAAEVIRRVEAHHRPPAVTQLRDAYRDLCGSDSTDT